MLGKYAISDAKVERSIEVLGNSADHNFLVDLGFQLTLAIKSNWGTDLCHTVDCLHKMTIRAELSFTA